MNYYLITQNPLALAAKPDRGNPIRRNGTQEDLDRFNQGLSEGYSYVPELEAPTFDNDTQRIERELTLDGYGWKVVDLTPEEIAARNAPPEQVTRRQLLLVLASMESPIFPEDIEEMIGANKIGLIEFRNAGVFERSHPLVSQLGVALNMTSDQIDDLFKQAQNI